MHKLQQCSHSMFEQSSQWYCVRGEEAHVYIQSNNVTLQI